MPIIGNANAGRKGSAFMGIVDTLALSGGRFSA